MNIDEVTVGQGTAPAASMHPMIGRYAIVRCESAGVHAGEVVRVNGDQVTLRNSRRLWRWCAKSGIALSGVAQHGVVANKSSLDAVNPEICIRGWIEIIPATDAARESIDEC